jgi:uncharacterized protein
MRNIDGDIRLSASDLMRFKGCRHATTLDLRHMEVGDLEPAADGDEAELLQRQGDAHELAFLDALRTDGRSIADIPKTGLKLEESVEATVRAMAEGPEVIFQGAFLGGAWGGYSDFLERVDRPSALGNWSYEVVDTKLKRSPDPKHILQLSLYSDLLAKVQGVAPEAAHLQLGDGSRFTVRLADVSAYARQSRRALETFIAERPLTRSEPAAACTLCRWRAVCREEWEVNDALPLIAGVSRSQRAKLEAAGVVTMTGLSTHEGRVPQLAAGTLARLQTQARLQSARRAGGPPAFELREPEAGKGLGLLPRPDDGDLFYDIEGDPYFPGGLEYLHGVWFRADAEWVFRAFWAHDREAEGQATAELMAFFVDHLRRHPDAHIYHYANYEIAALRRLTSSHRVGGAAMDQLQRERRFVDLFKVVSGGLTASEPGYSIKDLEVFYREKRDAEVATAGASVVFYERWRDTGDDAILDQIYDYNRTDCISTQQLRDWLVSAVRPASMAWPVLNRSPAEERLANLEAEDEAVAALRARLQPVGARLGPEIAELLLDLASFHAREDKPAWWAIFDRLAQESEDLIDDLDSLQGLEATGPAVQVTAKSYERTYRYPPQETKLRAGKKPCVKPAEMPEDIDLRALDPETRTVTLRRTLTRGALPDQLDLIPPKPLQNNTLRNAIHAVIEDLISGGAGSRAVEALLTRSAPRFASGPRPNGVIDPAADLPTQTSAAILDLDHATLAIQGPPGTGKTYVSALSIVDLVRAGRRVAVSSNSHKAITNLLAAVAERATAEGVPCDIVQKTSDDGEEDIHPGITLVDDNDAPEIGAADVVGATAWHFARYDAVAYDHLVVDEAGQVSLANILAMSRAARNLVLVGDPMQLPQPLQGSHPGRSGESCLEYLIDGHRVIPAERGIFIPVSRRMHPGICDYISRTVYEGQLQSDARAASQTLVSTAGVDLAGAGMRAVAHTGRSQVSPEEVDAIHATLNELVGSRYRNRDGVEMSLGLGDILVVAPYNAQVNALRAALPPAVRVGTVDRFQGQEAPVCLVSMTTSSGDEMPRDIGFLFSLNRINVAVSRAQARAMVFASPRLLETSCRTVEDLIRVNAVCALREHGGDTF